ncbi:GGDEF domain-containing protein [Arenimonas sp.]|uniref:GGDEF domain-containing protein n=1 Tax=Arenimonas sp. TaxID=1872635 RepID=UPI0035B04819
MRAPRRPRLVVPAALALGPGAASTAFAAGGEGHVMLAWALVGLALGVALAVGLCAWLLQGRIAAHGAWWRHALAALALLLLSSWLAWDWPWVVMLVSLGVAGWGLSRVLRLTRHMRQALDEHAHARAEARRAKADSERDALTGVLNRGAWRARLERLAEDTQQDGRPLSVLFFDIDLFKLINDSLGHQVGDDCLKAVASTVAAELRGGDILGRLGGEEFAVALPGARRIHAIAVGERVRMAVQSHCQVVGEEVVELTVSVGAAEYLGPGESFDALMDRADRAMYTAKGSGRNMVVADAATPPGAH